MDVSIWAIIMYECTQSDYISTHYNTDYCNLFILLVFELFADISIHVQQIPVRRLDGLESNYVGMNEVKQMTLANMYEYLIHIG